MIDFIDTFYRDTSHDRYDGYDEEMAKKKAFSTVLPLIMNNELTQKQSICLQYHYVNGKSQAEIAKMLHLSQPTVSRHINAAKSIVNNKLKYCYIAVDKGLSEYDRLSNIC